MYIFPPNPEWESEYRVESSTILTVYGEGIELFHIGSTAIPGLYAKDCIDILGVVNNIVEVQGKINSLVGIGYNHKGEYGIAGREYFSKSKRKVHLHVFEKGSDEIDRHLHFVRIMQSTPSLIPKLNELKCKLHAQFPGNKEQYQKEKVYFYNEINIKKGRRD